MKALFLLASFSNAYVTLFNEKRTRKGAEFACARKGGKLASKEDLDFLSQKLSEGKISPASIWMGMSFGKGPILMILRYWSRELRENGHEALEREL